MGMRYTKGELEYLYNKWRREGLSEEEAYKKVEDLLIETEENHIKNKNKGSLTKKRKRSHA